jgi:hypothetical protein
MQSFRILALGLLAQLLFSCSLAQPESAQRTPSANPSLANELAFPAWQRGQPCPRSTWEDIGKTGAPESLGAAGYYTVLGVGPAFPVVYNFGPTSGTLSFGAFVAQRGDPIPGRVWSKMRWIVAPRTGRVVIRGARLDGGSPVYFDIAGGDQLVLEMNAASDDWRDHGGGFSVPGPGCYGLRVESANWRTVLVLEVVP